MTVGFVFNIQVFVLTVFTKILGVHGLAEISNLFDPLAGTFI